MKIKTNNPESNLVKSLFRDFQIQILEGRQFTLNEKIIKSLSNQTDTTHTLNLLLVK